MIKSNNLHLAGGENRDQNGSIGFHGDSLQYLHFLHPCCPGRRTEIERVAKANR